MSITKAELARRLGMSPLDLVDRDEAARIISHGSKPLSAESLRVRDKASLPGFYNLSEAERGGEVAYRRDWLLKYKAWRDGKFDGPRPDKEMLWGRQTVPGLEDVGDANEDRRAFGLSPAEQALIEEFYRKSPKIIVGDDEVRFDEVGSGNSNSEDVLFRVVDTSGLSDAGKAMLEELSSKSDADDAGDLAELVLFSDGQLELTPEIKAFLLQSKELILAKAKLRKAGL